MLCNSSTSYVAKTHFTERYNKGFADRKNFLFNQTVPDGRFSFRIPLSFIFNFCEDYDKVIFNCKHEILFTRQEDKYAIFRDRDTAAGKINLEKIKLHMPVVTPAGLFKEELTNIVRNIEIVPMSFRGKKIENLSFHQVLELFHKADFWRRNRQPRLP